jgi:alpha-glucosidase
VPLPDARFHALHAAPDTSGGGVLVRVATRGAVPLRVDVRTEPDHEERLTPCTLVATQGPWRHYAAPLVRVTHDDVTRYAIRFLFPRHQAWLAQDGLHELMPLTDVHYRYRPGYVAAAWVWEQVAYQVFPDRFRDGDPTNNVRSGAYRYGGQPVVARGWDELPTRAHGPREFFGGDLDGVREALPYLEDLGATMLYLNPIFTSPSSHKYDTVDYDHVDPHLGGDEAFLRLVEALRSRGMRLVLDAVVNHTSERHPWFGKGSDDHQDAIGGAGTTAPGEPEAAATPPGAYHGPHSPTHDHYVFEDPADPESYRGWAGVRSLPVLDFSSPGVRDKVYEADDAIVRRWLRPPWSIDGWRLDVAHMLGEGPGARRNHDHLRAIRAAVKAERPDAYLLGEHFFEALPWLQGDEEDGAMNYDGFLRPMLAFWAGIDFRGAPLPLDAAGLDGWLTRVRARLPFEIQLSQLNLLDSHDVPRFLTRVGGDVAALAAAAHALFAYPGVPSIYYGDEIGLEGGEDPDNRRAFPWDEGRWDAALRETYRALARLRRRAPPLQRGGYGTLLAEGDVFAFARTLDGDAVITIVHRGADACAVTVPTWATGVAGPWTDALRGTMVGGGDHLTLALPPRSGTTLVSHEGWLGQPT